MNIISWSNRRRISEWNDKYILDKLGQIIILLTFAYIFSYIVMMIKNYSGISQDTYATLLGVVVAFLMVRRQLERKSNEFKYETLSEHVISASNNLSLHNFRDGLLIENNLPNRYIVSWGIRTIPRKNMKDSDDDNHYTLNLLFRVMKNDEKVDDILGLDARWWDYRILIPRFDSQHGKIVEISSFGGIVGLSTHTRICIMLAIKRIQLLSYNEIQKCNDDLINSMVKEYNFDLFNKNIFGMYRSFYSKI